MFWFRLQNLKPLEMIFSESALFFIGFAQVYCLFVMINLKRCNKKINFLNWHFIFCLYWLPLPTKLIYLAKHQLAGVGAVKTYCENRKYIFANLCISNLSRFGESSKTDIYILRKILKLDCSYDDKIISPTCKLSPLPSSSEQTSPPWSG